MAALLVVILFETYLLLIFPLVYFIFQKFPLPFFFLLNWSQIPPKANLQKSFLMDVPKVMTRHKMYTLLLPAQLEH